MLKADQPETPESIAVFLHSLDPVAESVRNDLVCARLLGSKTIESIDSMLLYSYEHDAGTSFKSNKTIWIDSSGLQSEFIVKTFQSNEDSLLYNDLINEIYELDKLGSEVNREVNLNISGFVGNVQRNYRNGELTSFKIVIQNARFSRIWTPRIVGNLDVQRAAIVNAKLAAYQKFMKIGLAPNSTPP